MPSQRPIVMGGGNELEGTGALSNIGTEREARKRWAASQPSLLDAAEIKPHTVQSIRSETEELRVGANGTVGGSLTVTSGVTADTFTLSSPRWEDAQFPVLAAKLRGSADPSLVKIADNGSGSTGVYVYAFATGADNEVLVWAQIPHAWDEETTIKPHVHWCPATGTDPTGTVVWSLEYWFSSASHTVVANSTIISTAATAAGSTAYKEQITGLGSGVTMTGWPISTIIVGRLFRDVSEDTYNDNALLLGFDWHYQIDTPGGSDEATSKT